METERRSVKRKALADCTNRALIASKPSSLAKPISTADITKKKKRKPNLKLQQQQEKELVSRNTDKDVRIPTPQPPISTPTPSLSPLNSSTNSNGEHVIVYSRSRPGAKSREKSVAEPFSCPPVRRKTNSKDIIITEHSIEVRGSKSDAGPSKRKRQSKPSLSDKYYEEQRAYFAEIDKFELPVEEVSESELE